MANESFILTLTPCFVAGLYRLKGAYDPTSDLEEMRREKEEADKESKVSILSLVGFYTENLYSMNFTSTFPATGLKRTMGWDLEYNG